MKNWNRANVKENLNNSYCRIILNGILNFLKADLFIHLILLLLLFNIDGRASYYNLFLKIIISAIFLFYFKEELRAYR